MNNQLLARSPDVSVAESEAPAPSSADPVAVYLASLAPGSRRAMYDGLAILGGMIAGLPKIEDPRLIPWAKLRFSETAALRAKIIERQYSPNYANKILCALRGVLRAAWRLGQMDSESYHRAIDLEPIRGSRVAPGREAEAAELRALFMSCRRDRKHFRGLRDACLLSLAYGAGLRRSEIAGLSLDAYSDERRELRLIGKGNSERLVPLPLWVVENIRAWLRVRGSEPGAMVCEVTQQGEIRSLRHVSDQSVYMALRRRVALAGVHKLTPHDFRRSYATEILEATGDLVATQRLLGHASPATTERYLRGVERQKKRAVAALRDPELL